MYEYPQMCMYTSLFMSKWAVVNKLLQLISDENRIKFMERDFLMEWAWKLGKMRKDKKQRENKQIDEHGYV